MPNDGPAIYLVLPPRFDPDADLARVSEALAAGPVEAVLLWLEAEDDEAAWKAACAALLPILHETGIPLIAGGEADRAMRLGADGAHLETNIDKVKPALSALKPQRMVGAGGVANRHNAMLAGEAGTDYVWFGTARPGRDQPIPPDAILDLVAWWSEIFQVPCVAPAATLDEAEALAAAGADFIAARDLVWSDEAGPAVALAQLAERLEAAGAEAPAS